MSRRKEFRLTNKGLKNVRAFLTECEAKRKEILDAKKDTAGDTTIPSVEDILSDINCGVGVDADGEYYNSWGVTDNYESDRPLGDSSSFYVEQWLDSDIAWGIFDNKKLMGYCTLGCADCCDDLYGEDTDFTDNAYVLSDVYVDRKYRHNGYGSELIQSAIRETWQRDNSSECVYLSPINDCVANWYNALGFRKIANDAMKLLPQ